MGIESTLSSGMHYVAFDKRTGRILHRHSRFDVETDAYAEVPIDDIRAMLVDDPAIIGALTDRDIANLEIMAVDSSISGPTMVDVTKRSLKPMPKLSLTADKSEIEGDGKDSTSITIEIRDADGKLVRGASGPIRITTTRGRLSARGGLVELVNGKAVITLTSVAETVNVVQVSASALGGLYGTAEITLEFV